MNPREVAALAAAVGKDLAALKEAKRIPLELATAVAYLNSPEIKDNRLKHEALTKILTNYLRTTQYQLGPETAKALAIDQESKKAPAKRAIELLKKDGAKDPIMPTVTGLPPPKESFVSMLGHLLLDVGGFDFLWFWTGPVMPFIAGAFDLINGIWYAYQKKWFMSLISVACAIAGGMSAGAADAALKSFKYLAKAKKMTKMFKLASYAMTVKSLAEMAVYIKRLGDEGADQIHNEDARVLIALDDLFQSGPGKTLINAMAEHLQNIGGNFKEQTEFLHEAATVLKEIKGWGSDGPYPWDEKPDPADAPDRGIPPVQKDRPFPFREPRRRLRPPIGDTAGGTAPPVQREEILKESEIHRWQLLSGINKRVI